MHLYHGTLSTLEAAEALLADARTRTRALVRPLARPDLEIQHSPLMSPIIWDLGHIAHFEEVWLMENLESGGEGSEGLRGTFNPFENPRSSRGDLALPSLDECFGYQDDVREAVLRRLRNGGVAGDPRLLQDGYVFRMVAQHEFQHNETILQTLQLKRGAPYAAPRTVWHEPGRSAGEAWPDMVKFQGGRVTVGTDDRSAAYDNERGRHAVELDPFWIDATPVTNGAYLTFMEAGGYASRTFWTEDGWAWLQESGAESPAYWSLGSEGWRVRSMDQTTPVDPTRPVCHVTYHEAAAFARFAGKRLPTETEWEVAATWSTDEGRARRFPWGDANATSVHANLDALAFAAAPVGSYPLNVSPIGCYGMIGDVWEWTSSDFLPYPGFVAFPYKEYSEVFFGEEHKVLRGGSWATRPGAIRSTFRNWDYPIRRQIFSGFRCARDA